MGRKTNIENIFFDINKKSYKENGELNDNVSLINVKDVISVRENKKINNDIIENLANDIEKNGMIYPIVVYIKEEKYYLIEGEKRLRAVKKLKNIKIEAIIKEIEEKKLGAVNILENLKNYKNKPIEEARAYNYLINNFGYRQQDISNITGKSRSSIANSIRLLNLHPQIIEWINEKKITVGHAKSLSSVKNQAAQMNFAKAVLDYEISVHLLEGMVSRYNNTKKKNELIYSLPNELSKLVKKIEKAMDIKTSLKGSVKKGEITLTYFDNETLTNIDKMMDIIIKNEEKNVK